MTGQLTNGTQRMGWGGLCAAMERRGELREGDLETEQTKESWGKECTAFLTLQGLGREKGPGLRLAQVAQVGMP